MRTASQFGVRTVPVLVLLLVRISWSLSCSLSARFLSSCSCRFKSFSYTHTHTQVYFLIIIFHAPLLSNYSAKYFSFLIAIQILVLQYRFISLRLSLTQSIRLFVSGSISQINSKLTAALPFFSRIL